MPISEDEYDSKQGIDRMDSHQTTLSKAELRKTNKPIMEKKRRARINQCLSELKDLILEAMKKDPARHSKLEKADILEMTVRHLQATQRRSLAAAAAADPAVLARFREGFAECAAEATEFLNRSSALAPPARARLRHHLSSCISALGRPTAPVPQDYNGNLHVGGVPLVPSRLPTGELALLLPPDARLAFPPPSVDFVQSGVSAFRSVRHPDKPPSPASSASCDSSSEPETPPRKQLSAAFPTPPSGSSFVDSSPETQKATISSTTTSPKYTKEELNITKAGDVSRKIEEYSFGQLTPSSHNSSTEYGTSPPMALNYSLTPSTGRKRAYPHPSDSPPRVISPMMMANITCPKVSSSMRGEDEYKPDEKKTKKLENKEIHQAGSSTGGDMWRPW